MNLGLNFLFRTSSLEQALLEEAIPGYDRALSYPQTSVRTVYGD